jgi:PKD repeat protein
MKLVRLLFFTSVVSICTNLSGQDIKKVYPNNDLIISYGTDVTFSWSDFGFHDNFILELSEDNSFSSIFAQNPSLTSDFQIVNLQNGIYYWRVIGLRLTGGNDTSDVGRFSMFDLKSIPNLNIWLRPDTGTTIVNNRITSWSDLSDSALVINVPNQSFQPLIIDSALNNYPVAYMDANDKFSFPIDLTGDDFSIHSVYNVRTNVGRSIRYIYGNTGFAFGPLSGQHRTFDAVFTIGKPVELNKYVVHSVTSFNDTLRNYVNDVYYNQTLNGINPGTQITVGQNALIGNVAEIIIVSGAINLQQRDSIDLYLLDKYAPPINLGKDEQICGFPYTINAYKSDHSSYLWSTGSTDSAITINASGSYKLTVTDMFNRSSVDSITVLNDTNNYQISFAGDSTICLGDSILLDGGNVRYDYLWSNGLRTNSITVSAAGKYSVTVTNCIGVTSIDSINVIVSDPSFSLGNDTSICSYNTVTIGPDNLFYSLYRWSNSSTDSTINVFNSGDFSLTTTNQFGCFFSDTVKITSDSTLFGNSLGNDTSLCLGNSIGLQFPLVGVDSYQWSTTSSDSFIVVNSSSNYSVTVTEDGCVLSDSVNIIVKGVAPNTGFLADNFCLGDSTVFTDTTTDPININLTRWSWNFGDGQTSSNQNPLVQYTNPGAYLVRLEVENDSGCIGLFETPIIINSTPNSEFSASLLCSNDTIQFLNQSVVSNDTITAFNWDFGDLTANSDTSVLVNPAYLYGNNSSYSVRLISTTSSGCKDTLIKQIAINPSAVVDFIYSGVYLRDTIFFTNQSQLTSGTISNYSWTFGNGSSSSIINPKTVYNAKGIYVVNHSVTTDSSCFSTKTDTIKIIDSPARFTTIYPKQFQVLNGSIPFHWEERDSANRYELNLSEDSNFTVNKQVYSSVKEIFGVNNLPVMSYYWKVIAIKTNQRFDSTEVFKFTVFSPLAIDSLNLWIKSDTAISLLNGHVQSWSDLSDSSLVLNQPVAIEQPTLRDSSINNLPALFFDANDRMDINLSVNKANYSISCVYNLETQVSRSIRMIYGINGFIFGPFGGVHRTFNGVFTSGKPVVQGDYVVHTANSVEDTIKNYVNNVFYSQALGATRPGNSFRIGQNPIIGNIAEIVIVNGKLTSDNRRLLDKYLLDRYSPPLNLGQNRVVCSFPDSIEVVNNEYKSFLWSTNDTTSKTVIEEPGKYFLTVTDQFNQTHTDSIYFILDTANRSVDLDFKDTTICFGDSVQIDAGNVRFTYSWNNGTNSPSLFLKNKGTYVVTQTNCLGTTSQDSLSITVNSPEFNLGADTTTCFNSIISLSPDSTFSNVSYIWSTNEIVSSVVANLSNAYSLTVTDNFLCSFSDTVTVTIDSSIFGITLGPDTSLCRGNIIGLLNQPTAISSYNWSTSETSVFATIDTSGSYKVEVGNGRCLISDTIEIVVKGDAPVVDFSFSNLCFKDSLMFVDNSVVPTGDTLKYWSWEFGNGDSSIVSDPKYKYSNRSDYVVFLKVETNRGCADTISKVIRIEHLPNANFNFQNNNACAKARIFHQDSSFIGRGFVNKYFWNFGDSNSIQNTSISKDPFHTYDTLGNYSVKLIIESDQGCKDSISKTITVHPTPNVNFVVNNFCISDSVGLQDATVFAGADTLNYFWTIRKIGSSFTVDRRQNPKIKINTAGLYDIGLRVRNNLSLNEWCEVNKKDTIEFFNSPIADFNIPKICENDSFSIINMSTSIDSLIDYRFILDNRDTVKIPDANFEGLPNGNYSLRLKVINNKSCADSIQKVFEVFSKPEVGFTILNNNTGIPFSVDLDNRTTNAISYIWDFGNGDTSHLRIPEFTYSDTGTYRLNLIATSIEGCTDSAHQELYALLKFLDASLDKLFLIENNLGGITVSFQIVNTGFNTIRSLLVAADLNNDFQFRESYDTKVYAGRKEGFEMETSFIPDAGKKIDFVCVRIIQVNEELDSITQNNELCESGYNNEFTLKLYPNPVDDFLHLQYTIPDDGVVDLQFFDVLGRRMDIGINLIQEEGYYASVIDLSRFNRGIYFYRFSFSGNTKKGSILKK